MRFFNLANIMQLLFLSSCLICCAAEQQEKICGINFPDSSFSGSRPYGTQQEFSAAENSSYAVLGKYIVKELNALGAKVIEQPVLPSKKIMKKPPTFAPRTKINIFAEFSCAAAHAAAAKIEFEGTEIAGNTANKTAAKEKAEKTKKQHIIVLAAPYADKDSRAHTAALMNIADSFSRKCTGRDKNTEEDISAHDKARHTFSGTGNAAGKSEKSCGPACSPDTKTILAAVFYDKNSEEAAINAAAKMYGGSISCFAAINNLKKSACFKDMDKNMSTEERIKKMKESAGIE